ncbi:hypothetical protein ABIE89_000399 [Bradyrhizobium niftali]|uniref:IS630 family transposase n=1 Tax=Bradyrhizobium niftali TaxID=2560055 RepID=UPI003833F245
MVRRILRAFGLQAHRMETFKFMTDPNFVTEVRDVVGLYVSPPEHAIVLCVDETVPNPGAGLQPADPVDASRPCHRRSHDYNGHGTTSLFAAFDTANRAAIGMSYGRHRTAEFRKFLDEIAPGVLRGLDVDLVMDNYVTHKAPLIRKWLVKRARWHAYSTPTSSSWTKSSVPSRSSSIRRSGAASIAA